tara:strand:+ start:82 stop:621 length:540 start_codon:yes stop_codon:yes gene_type:complete
MNFIELDIKDAYLITPDIYSDNRGNFNRSFCQREFKKKGLDNNISQGNISENPMKYTLRGFHYQLKPYEESKTICCITGSIFDSIIDLRKESSTFLKYISLTISSKSKQSIFVPKGCANGWLTLENNTIIHYYMGSFYQPGFDRGIRFNDKFFNIKWPSQPNLISTKDLSYPDFSPEKF